MTNVISRNGPSLLLKIPSQYLDSVWKHVRFHTYVDRSANPPQVEVRTDILLSGMLAVSLLVQPMIPGDFLGKSSKNIAVAAELTNGSSDELSSHQWIQKPTKDVSFGVEKNFTSPSGTTVPISKNDIASRPGLGAFTDTNYKYPHLRIETGMAKPTLVTFGKFAGAKAKSGWYSRYIGVPRGTIPEQAVVDPLEQHARMFAIKYARADVTPVAFTMQQQYREMYNTQRTYMTLGQFVSGVGMVIEESKAAIDWKAFCADKRIRLNNAECLTARRIVDLITPEMMVAYMETELLPEDKQYKGKFNAWVLDNGFRNYGREFWDLSPAISDGLASGGLGQATRFMIGAYTDEDGQPQTGPATILSRYSKIKAPQKSESFLDLVRDDHERASFYYAVHNIALLVRDASRHDEAYRSLNRVWLEEQRTAELLEFIATSHHAHNGVRRYAMNWLKKGAEKPFYNYLKGRFKPYARRTRTNYPGLVAYLAETDTQKVAS